MLIFNKRYELFNLSKKHRLPKIYDLLNRIRQNNDVPAPACTDGKHIYVNTELFEDNTAEEQFFIICHELLHILYHHSDENYYPRDKYQHRDLLNVCQDVVINEYLAKRLNYRHPSGLYLDNFLMHLKNCGYLLYSNASYRGVLSTPELYEYLMQRLNLQDENLDNLLKNLNDNNFDGISIDSNAQDDNPNAKVQEKLDETVLKDTLENLIKGLKITDEILNQETIDRDEDAISNAGNSNEYTEKVVAGSRVKTISANDMIKFIEQFIGNNAVIKGRHRTYSRPSRRINLEHNLVAPGYKQQKTINKIQIYLDVSGSMDVRLVQNLFGTLKSLYNRVQFDLFIFTWSTQYIDIKNTEYLPVGGGTNIQNVLDKIKSENQEAAILITDCEDKFSLKNVDYNLMLYTNNKHFKSDNKNVQLTYFE